MRPESPGRVSLLRRTAAEASTQITLEATRAIAALTRRTHRMAFSCQRGRVLRRFRQNACRVDTQNAQNADFLSTRPRCCRWKAQKASTHITLEATGAIAALTRRMHRMPFSCQRGRVLRRFRQNACRVDTQNAQKAFFPSTRPAFVAITPESLPRRHVECTECLFSVNAAGFCAVFAKMLAALTRRTHRMVFSCQRGQGVAGGKHKKPAHTSH